MALRYGASLREDGSIRFAVWAPRAERVSVQVVRGPRTGEWPLAAEAGVFEGVVAGLGAGADYVYRLATGAGIRERPDPASRFQPRGVHGASRIVDPCAFRWTDGRWRAPDAADLVLYEVHVGTFTAAGTFDGAVAELPALRELGVTAIELMPVGEFPGARNWGYDGVHPYAPQSTYGGPEGLRRLVNAAHGIGLAVVLDVVYNHLGPEGNHLAEFGPYFTDRYRTPWGPAVNFDGPDSDQVRRWVVDNAVYWVTEFHVDGLRLDAVHAIFDCGARHILEEIAAAVHEEAARLGRRAYVIAESDLNDPRLVRAPERGGHGLDAQWSDDFHHAVHVALTGERDGYYADFGGVAPVAKSLRDRFVYDGRHSAHRRRRHGAPAADLPADRFVVFIQNHDQVGNRAQGDRLATLVPPARRRLAAALLLLSPYVPLLFMGEEYGETNPFLYFVSHGDPDLAAAVRDGRRREFARFTWGGDVPDPQAVETFLRSRLDRTRADGRLLALYRDCLRLRREEPALRPGGAAIGVDADPGAGWVTLALAPATGALLVAVFNLAEAQDVPVVAVPRTGRTAWAVALSTDAERYGGSGVPTPVRDETVGVPPWSAVLLRETPR
jgi:maltooligosyltrehalose trehalohydrolase